MVLNTEILDNYTGDLDIIGYDSHLNDGGQVETPRF
jgi:hypothetical protein